MFHKERVAAMLQSNQRAVRRYKRMCSQTAVLTGATVMLPGQSAGAVTYK
jgi:hypothetical protein